MPRIAVTRVGIVRIGYSIGVIAASGVVTTVIPIIVFLGFLIVRKYADRDGTESRRLDQQSLGR